MAHIGREFSTYDLSLLILCCTVHLVVTISHGDTPWNNVRGTAAWKVSEYGACTTRCNGGIQVRRVECVEKIKFGGQLRSFTAPISSCPRPKPVTSRPCNTHSCLAKWVSSKWSQCSVTCGLGTTTREVRCEASTFTGSGARPVVSDLDCGGTLRPAKSRQCHQGNCPELEGPAILTENYTLWQLTPADEIKANIGGEVNILRGQSVTLHCPVADSSFRDKVFWSKNKRLLLVSGHKLIVKEPGVYTCNVFTESATITVKYISDTNAVPQSLKSLNK